MEQLGTNYKLPDSKITKTSERAELIRVFLDRLRNKEGKPYTPAFLGMKLSPIKTADLYSLQKKCEQARNFGAMFWYLLK